MDDAPPATAWLERQGSEPIPVTGNCSLGRAVDNQVALVDDRVSRRHATIHAQGDREFLLVDLGSRNGTFLNGRRVNQPTRLQDGDQLQVGPFQLVFHQAAVLPMPDAAVPEQQRQEPQTMVELESTPCWLLLCDITGSSVLAREKTGAQLAMLVGGWFAKCKEVIEDNGGAINKYLGDGFLAYWRARKEFMPHVAQALRDLGHLQLEKKPDFRVVLHYGQVTIGGIPSSGEDSLAGPEVNLVFRLERLASELRQLRLASGKAVEALGELMSASPAGEHELHGFEGKHAVFTF
jgi:adenylate cyclase